MMVWFEISEERLAREKEMDTPIDIMTWDYYQYVKEHPVQKWNIETNILFAGRDTLQSLEIVKDFVDNFNCVLTLSENSEPSFMGEEDGLIIEQWLQDTNLKYRRYFEDSVSLAKAGYLTVSVIRIQLSCLVISHPIP